MRPEHIFPDFHLIQQRKLEEEATRAIMDACKLPKQLRIRVIEEARRKRESLSPAIFEEVLPNFPFLFVVQQETQLKEFGKLATFWHKRSRRSEVLKLQRVAESHLAASEFRLLGVLLRLPYVAGWSIMHAGIQPQGEAVGVCLTFAVEDAPPFESHMHIEPLDQFVLRHAESIAAYLRQDVTEWTG